MAWTAVAPGVDGRLAAETGDSPAGTRFSSEVDRSCVILCPHFDPRGQGEHIAHRWAPGGGLPAKGGQSIRQGVPAAWKVVDSWNPRKLE